MGLQSVFDLDFCYGLPVLVPVASRDPAGMLHFIS